MNALYKNEDQVGKIFGPYKVLDFVEYIRDAKGKVKDQRWLVICNFCQREHQISKSYLTKGKNLNVERCAKCPKLAKDSFRWTGGDFIPGSFYQRIKDNASLKRRGRDILFSKEITIEYLEKLFISQGRRCVYSGWPLEFSTNHKENTASLDRIDSKSGYEIGNVQFVHKLVNTMKWSFPEEDFLEMCKDIVYYQNFIKNPPLPEVDTTNPFCEIGDCG